MATNKKNAAKVNSEMVEMAQNMVNEKFASFANMTLEDVLLQIESLDKVSTSEKHDMLNVFIEKSANVIANEKKVDRVNKCYGTLCKLNDKKLARDFEHAFIVLSSNWGREGKKLVTLLGTNTVKFSNDGKLKLVHCDDTTKFAEAWAYHKQAIEFNQTTILSYVAGVKVSKESTANTLDDTKKAIVKLYKAGDMASRKLLADFMREKGIDIPTF